MTFIRIGSTVINTNHIAAVDLNHVSIGGKRSLVIQMAVSEGPFNWKLKTFRFSGQAAKKLLAYFSDPNNVIDCSKLQSSDDRDPPSSQPLALPPRGRIGGSSFPRRLGAPQSTEPPASPFDQPYEEPHEERWDEFEDPSDDPPSPPTIRRRPWGPKSPNPLSAATFPDPLDPTIP